MPQITYVIADDHKIFRQGLMYALADDDTLKFVGEAEHGIDLLKLVEKELPDVVLVDIKMPVMDGIEATQKIHAGYPGVKILVLSTHDDEQLILHMLECGANGYLLKNANPDEIKKAIHCVYENDYYFNDLLNNTMLRSIKIKNTEKSVPLKLSEREIEVLKLICEELTATEIAAKVFLSPRTVEGIRTTLKEKIGVKNTAGLVIYAVKAGIIN